MLCSPFRSPLSASKWFPAGDRKKFKLFALSSIWSFLSAMDRKFANLGTTFPSNSFLVCLHRNERIVILYIAYRNAVSQCTSSFRVHAEPFARSPHIDCSSPQYTELGQRATQRNAQVRRIRRATVLRVRYLIRCMSAGPCWHPSGMPVVPPNGRRRRLPLRRHQVGRLGRRSILFACKRCSKWTRHDEILFRKTKTPPEGGLSFCFLAKRRGFEPQIGYAPIHASDDRFLDMLSGGCTVSATTRTRIVQHNQSSNVPRRKICD